MIRFSSGHAIVGCLDAVCNRIDNQLANHFTDLVDELTIDDGRFTFEDQLDVPIDLLGQVLHELGKGRSHSLERYGRQPERCVLEVRRSSPHRLERFERALERHRGDALICTLEQVTGLGNSGIDIDPQRCNVVDEPEEASRIHRDGFLGRPCLDRAEQAPEVVDLAAAWIQDRGSVIDHREVRRLEERTGVCRSHRCICERGADDFVRDGGSGEFAVRTWFEHERFAAIISLLALVVDGRCGLRHGFG